jgi:hypothetical protein
MKWLEISYSDVIPDSPDFTRVELNSLIDLALATYDRDWFEELTMQNE